MNIFQLVLKQMRQRALSTWLTFLSVALGVALAIAILLLHREGDKLFTQADFGFDSIVGSKTGGRLNIVLNAVYQLGSPSATVPYTTYEALQKNPIVQWALPWAVGDNYHNYRVIGTSPAVIGLGDDLKPLPPDQVFQYRKNRTLELASGQCFHPQKFQAIIGAEVAERTDLKIGSKFKASHGAEDVGGVKDEHDETWEVVGILKPTQTAMDRLIFIPIISALSVPEHAEVMEQVADIHQAAEADHDKDHAAEGAAHHHHDHEEVYALRPDGTIDLQLPRDKWGLSAVLVRTVRGQSQQLAFETNNQPYAQAVNPASEMRQFFNSFLKGSRILLLTISTMVTIVAAVGILVSIYNSVSARLKEIAIIRALGATRLKVLSLICLEAGFVALIGGIAGLIGGHAFGAVGDVFFRQYVGEGIDYLTVSGSELGYLGLVVVIGILAGLVPALKAYKTPVATNLAG